MNRCAVHQIKYQFERCPLCTAEGSGPTGEQLAQAIAMVDIIRDVWADGKAARQENVKLRECIKQFIANWDLWGASIHGLADHSDKQLTTLTNEILDVARELVGDAP